MKVKSLSWVQLFATPYITCQAPPSVGFSRQEYWSGLPFPSAGIFLTQGLNPGLPHCRQTLHHLSHQGILIYIYTYMYFFFFCLFQPCRLLRSIEYIYLCYTAGPCWLSYIVVCVYIYVNPKLLIYLPFPFVLWYFRYVFVMPVEEETEEMEGDRVSRKVFSPLNLLIS